MIKLLLDKQIFGPSDARFGCYMCNDGHNTHNLAATRTILVLTCNCHINMYLWRLVGAWVAQREWKIKLFLNPSQSWWLIQIHFLTSIWNVSKNSVNHSVRTTPIISEFVWLPRVSVSLQMMNGKLVNEHFVWAFRKKTISLVDRPWYAAFEHPASQMKAQMQNYGLTCCTF